MAKWSDGVDKSGELQKFLSTPLKEIFADQDITDESEFLTAIEPVTTSMGMQSAVGYLNNILKDVDVKLPRNVFAGMDNQNPTVLAGLICMIAEALSNIALMRGLEDEIGDEIGGFEGEIGGFEDEINGGAKPDNLPTKIDATEAAKLIKALLDETVTTRPMLCGAIKALNYAINTIEDVNESDQAILSDDKIAELALRSEVGDLVAYLLRGRLFEEDSRKRRDTVEELLKAGGPADRFRYFGEEFLRNMADKALEARGSDESEIAFGNLVSYGMEEVHNIALDDTIVNQFVDQYKEKNEKELDRSLAEATMHTTMMQAVRNIARINGVDIGPSGPGGVGG